MLSESDSKVYTTFDFRKEKIIHIKKKIDLQSQAIYVDKTNSKKSLHVLKDDISGMQVGNIEQVIV